MDDENYISAAEWGTHWGMFQDPSPERLIEQRLPDFRNMACFDDIDWPRLSKREYKSQYEKATSK